MVIRRDSGLVFLLTTETEVLKKKETKTGERKRGLYGHMREVV